MLPITWEELLHAPAFVISRDPERYEICRGRVQRAGFAGEIHHSPGVDPDHLETEWQKHPFPPNRRPFGRHPAAVMLAHLNLWAHMLERDLPYAVIFEDDPLFHTEWHSLAGRYYDATPKDIDMIFMGHHCGNVHPEAHVVQTPVYCLNAYVLTRDGAKKLYKMITEYAHDDFGVIDMMLVRLQHDILFTQQNPHNYRWYAWNTQMYPDIKNDKYKQQEALGKDMGFVFQQNPFFRLDIDL